MRAVVVAQDCKPGILAGLNPFVVVFYLFCPFLLNFIFNYDIIMKTLKLYSFLAMLPGTKQTLEI